MKYFLIILFLILKIDYAELKAINTYDFGNNQVVFVEKPLKKKEPLTLTDWCALALAFLTGVNNCFIALLLIEIISASVAIPIIIVLTSIITLLMIVVAKSYLKNKRAYKIYPLLFGLLSILFAIMTFFVLN